MAVMSPEAAQLIRKQSEDLVAAATLHHALINNYAIEVTITPDTIPPGSINPGADAEVLRVPRGTLLTALRVHLKSACEKAMDYHIDRIVNAVEDQHG